MFKPLESYYAKFLYMNDLELNINKAKFSHSKVFLFFLWWWWGKDSNLIRPLSDCENSVILFLKWGGWTCWMKAFSVLFGQVGMQCSQGLLDLESIRIVGRRQGPGSMYTICLSRRFRALISSLYLYLMVSIILVISWAREECFISVTPEGKIAVYNHLH